MVSTEQWSVYGDACRLVCAVADEDVAEVEGVLTGMHRFDMERLIVMLASMVPDDAFAPRAVVESRTKFAASSMAIGRGDVVIDDTIKAVAEAFDVKPEDILSRSLDRRVIDARHVVCYLKHKVEGRSYHQIARVLGRDHSTIHYSVQRVLHAPRLQRKAEAVIASATKEIA